MFDKTGALALWSGGRGFEGPILGPGTYFTGCYPEIRMVECAQKTVKESLTALTKDGVQFSLDVYISYGANCDEEKAVTALLTKLSPEGTPSPAKEGDKAPESTGGHMADPRLTISADQIYRVYVRPAIGEAVREAVSPYIANDVNGKREEIFDKIKKLFEESLKKQDPRLVVVYALNLSNLDFPDAMDKANTERAAQAILKDKAIAEREKVQAEIETAKLDIVKKEVEAQAEAKKIDTIGAALHRNPEYYIRDVYYYAADKGSSVMVPSDPKVILQMTPKRP
jgi:regulator of protease activity HflC (stomatin/prohibitin superfamily)